MAASWRKRNDRTASCSPCSRKKPHKNDPARLRRRMGAFRRKETLGPAHLLDTLFVQVRICSSPGMQGFIFSSLFNIVVQFVFNFFEIKFTKIQNFDTAHSDLQVGLRARDPRLPPELRRVPRPRFGMRALRSLDTRIARYFRSPCPRRWL